MKDNKKLTYFKYMLEREVVIRCVKHILNQDIRDNESSELLGAMISHIFNCLLAPKEFIKRLDDGVLKYEPVTVKSIADDRVEEAKQDTKTDVKVQEAPVISKKEKLRQKKAKAQEASANESKEDQQKEKDDSKKTFTNDIGELLFKSPYDDLKFEAEELFMEPMISMNVCESVVPDVFSLTPKKFYQQIRELAEKRYKYTTLPKKLVQL